MRLLRWIISTVMAICGRCQHNWSRPFYDRTEKHDYQRCLECGERRKSPIQFHEQTHLKSVERIDHAKDRVDQRAAIRRQSERAG